MFQDLSLRRISDFNIVGLRIAKNTVAKKSSEHPIMVVESQVYGTEEMETLPLKQEELEAIANNFLEEEPVIPSAPAVPCQ